MLREIDELLFQLEKRKPFGEAAFDAVKARNAADWCCSCLLTASPGIQREAVEQIVGGRFLPEVSVAFHNLIQRHLAVLKKITDLLEMKNDLNNEIFLELAACFTEGRIRSYRSGPSALDSFSFVHPGAEAVPGEMKRLFFRVRSGPEDSGSGGNPILGAALLHNSIFAIDPFDGISEDMARFAMYYHLMSRGYPVFALRFSPREYREAVSLFLLKNETDPFYKGLERSLYNGIDLLLRITAPAE